MTPPPSTSVLGKHERGNGANLETDDTGDDGGAIHSHVSRLRTDFDVSKQASRFCLRTVDIETEQSI